MTLWDVRYYDKVLHPDHFKGSGWRGRLIVILNWMRCRLELFVQRQVVLWLAGRGTVPNEKRKELLRTFDLDVRQEILVNERTSPLHEVEHEDLEPVPNRSLRYQEGAQTSALDEAMDAAGAPPMRPEPLSNLIAQYGFAGRAKKYARGKKFTANPDGDFEPLTEE